MPDEDRDLRRLVALFHFRLLAPLVRLPAGSDELAVELWAISAREHELPAKRRIRVGSRTECGRRSRASTVCCGRPGCWAGPGGAGSVQLPALYPPVGQ